MIERINHLDHCDVRRAGSSYYNGYLVISDDLVDQDDLDPDHVIK